MLLAAGVGDHITVEAIVRMNARQSGASESVLIRRIRESRLLTRLTLRSIASRSSGPMLPR